ncbi:MAG: hypothetical protein AAGI54_00630 [Planctomycetota bacterium]
MNHNALLSPRRVLLLAGIVGFGATVGVHVGNGVNRLYHRLIGLPLNEPPVPHLHLDTMPNAAPDPTPDPARDTPPARPAGPPRNDFRTRLIAPPQALEYRGPLGRPGVCALSVFRLPPAGDDCPQYLVVFTELPRNPGPHLLDALPQLPDAVLASDAVKRIPCRSVAQLLAGLTFLAVDLHGAHKPILTAVHFTQATHGGWNVHPRRPDDHDWIAWAAKPTQLIPDFEDLQRIEQGL